MFGIVLGLMAVAPQAAWAQETSDADAKYVPGVIERVVEEGEREIEGLTIPYQFLDVRLDWPRGSETREVLHTGDPISGDYIRHATGERVVVVELLGDEGPVFSIIDYDRRWPLFLLAVAFLILVVIVAGRRGLGAVVGAGVSLLILGLFVAPRILAGNDPMWTALAGSVAIVTLTIVLAHGWKRQTLVAWIGTLFSLGAAALAAWLAVLLTRLSGTGSEQALVLALGPLGQLSLQGILLAGIIIGALGALDDVTTTQAATVFELHAADPGLPARELFRRGLSVGREHVSALVNTLVLAYAGAAFPLFLLVYSQLRQPVWLLINSEFLAEEIVRSLVGTSALVLAVPITTGLAALAAASGRFDQRKRREASERPA